MKYCSIFVLLPLLCLISVRSEKKESETSDVFVPSKEWKTVKKGQPIPPGLHVRMNLQTGLTEAKLMDSDSDENDKTSKHNAMIAVDMEVENDVGIEHQNEAKIVQTAQHVDGVHVMSSEDGKQTLFANGKLTRQQLHEALKNLDFEDVEVATDEDIQRVKEKFRSIDELKEELAELNLGMRSEAEEVSQLMQQFSDADEDEDDQLTALRELEYIVHHVDAAKDLIQGDGINLIIIPALNSSSYNLQCAGARLVGAASQGNPTVQLAALEKGVLRLLLRHLSIGVGAVGDSFDETHQKIKATVYAISCLIRGFPLGQRNLVEQGGLAVLAKLFDDSNFDIKIKITTLLHDLVVESDEATKAKEQYQAVALKEKLSQYGWCERISLLLESPGIYLKPATDEESTEVKKEDLLQHDDIEKIVSSMLVLNSQCKVQFQIVLQTVKDLVATYNDIVMNEDLFQSEEIPTYFSELLLLIEKLLASMSFKKDEL